MNRYFKFAIHLFAVIGFSSASAGSYEDFFRALNADNAAAVQQLLARGFDPNARDEKGQVALYVALRHDAIKTSELLLAQPNLQVDERNAAGETALMMAALRGHLAAAQRLVQRGAGLHQDGWSAVHYAASGPSTAMLQWLLEQGAPVDARAPNGSTPLMMAANYGPESSVKLLLQRRAQAGLRNSHGHSAADLARLAGREALAKELDSAAAAR